VVMVEGSRHRDGMSTLRGRAPGGRDSASLEECPHAVVRELKPCSEPRTAVSQQSREPGRGIGGSRFRLSCIGTIRVDEVPGWAESGQYISVRRSSVEASVGVALHA
jgi:hypothetical protein